MMFVNAVIVDHSEGIKCCLRLQVTLWANFSLQGMSHSDISPGNVDMFLTKSARMAV
jgi:hypothetical protein